MHTVPNASHSRKWAGRPQSSWGDTGRRLRRSPVAVISLAIIAAFSLAAVLAPVLAPHDPMRLYLDSVYRPPLWTPDAPGGISPDARFPLGTDSAGRDLLSRFLYGTRTSMAVGWLAAPLIALVGSAVGLIAGFAGPRVDNLLMRLTDVFYAFPNILFSILVMLILRNTPAGKWLDGVVILILALVAVSWVGAARLVRATVLSIKHSPFVEGALAIGASRRRVLLRHILPNCLGPVVVWMAFTIPQLIIAEAVLGYLGIGIKPAADPSESFFVTSWGGLFLDGRRSMSNRPWMLLTPALAISLVALAFNLLGDALRDALDPKSRS